MLEGLEISIIRKSDLENKKARIDSDYYQKIYLRTIEKIETRKYTSLGDIIEVLTDYHANGSYETLRKHVELLDTPSYAHMVRTSDFIRDDFDKNIKYVTQEAYNHLKKTQLFGDEILVNKIGTNSGQNFLMPRVEKPSTLGMNIFLIRLMKGFSPKVYQAFLSTKIGLTLINQKINGAAPKSIDKDSIRDIIVPVFSPQFQELVEKTLGKVSELKVSADKMYSQSQKLLYKYTDIDFNCFNKSTQNEKRLSESLFSCERIDSEYYLPKYDDLVKAIKSNNFSTLNELVTLNKSIEPGSSFYSEDGIPFIRVSDYSHLGLTKPDKYLSNEFIKNNFELVKSLHPKKNTILFSKDGTVGIAYKLEKDEEIITSGAVLHLKVKNTKKILPDYLTLILNSQIVKLQSERDCGGSVILHWLPKQIEQVLIPILEWEKQVEISNLVKESFLLRQQSRDTLNIIKLAIEQATINGEEVATKVIKERILISE